MVGLEIPVLRESSRSERVGYLTKAWRASLSFSVSLAASVITSSMGGSSWRSVLSRPKVLSTARAESQETLVMEKG